MINLKVALIGGAVTAAFGGLGWLGADFVEAKKIQVQTWADVRYVQQASYEKTENRKEKRRIKREIFEIRKEEEKRPLSDVEKRHLEDLHDDLQELQ